MNKQEFGVFASALRTYYPKEQLLPNKQAMELWYRQIKDIPFPIAEMALQKWVASNKWSPTISDLRGKISAIHWEAYDLVTAHQRNGKTESEEYKRLKWVYDVTQDYKTNKFVEPSVADMIGGSNMMMLTSGDERM